MFFYQINTDEVTTVQLKNAIFNGNNNPKIHHFNFYGFPASHTIDHFLSIVEAKRKTLGNPDCHSFLSFELLLEPTTDLNKSIALSEQVTDAINRYYDYDLYIASLVYDDDDNHRHTCILMSDIEKSLYSSNTTTVLSDPLEGILQEALPEYVLEPITYHSLYLFNSGTGNKLSYDGVVHIQRQALDL